MRILVADDSPVLRMAVSKLLEPEGYDVVVAEDGVEAITQFYDQKPDLVLLDVQMPKLNGYVVCRLLKEDPTAANIPVLILTVRTSEEDRYWGLQSGADGYLTKDALGDELLTAIRSKLASKALRELSGVELAESGLTGEGDVLTRVCELLDRKLFEATVVNEITSVATKPVGIDATVEEILTALRRLVSFDAGAVVLPEQHFLELHVDHPLAEEDEREFDEIAIRSLKEMASGDADDLGDYEIHHLNTVEGEADEPMGWNSIRAIPLRSRGQLLGVLVLGAHKAGAFGEAQRRTLGTVTPSIAAVIDSAGHYQTAIEVEAREAFSSLF